ncbi:MAG: protein kinase [Bdellovibrionales bacterium]|nr:protein kinase [Bdellovibrionales bacterium]
MAKEFERFGKYILLEKLAAGGMAEVFLARSTGASGIGKFVAIKRILPQFTDNKEFIRMFKDEAKIAMNLSHGNIVSIYEFGVENQQFFLVMEYVEGRNLRQILNKMKKKSSKFSVEQIVYIINQISAGLDHAHRCLDGSTGKPLNITHRDMSPQNVMLTFEGEIKVVDFGIAKAESQIESTRAGTLKGKFGYMSPEQAEGHEVDLRTDIFSLGIILWELLTNERLFVSNNEINTLRKIRECNIPSLKKYNPNIHPELERITMKALSRDKNLRYQTSAALNRDLTRFLNRQFPDFSPQDFAISIKTLFADEILKIRKRMVSYAKKTEITEEEDHDFDEFQESMAEPEKENILSRAEAFGQFEPATKTDSDEDSDEEKNILDTGALSTQLRTLSDVRGAKPISLENQGTNSSIPRGTRYTITNHSTRSRSGKSDRVGTIFSGLLTVAAVLMIIYYFYSSQNGQHNNASVAPQPQLTQQQAPTPEPSPPTYNQQESVEITRPAVSETTPTEAPQTYSRLPIQSVPSGAEIFINGKSTGQTTPYAVSVPANKAFTLGLRKRGYVEYVKESFEVKNLNQPILKATLIEEQIGYVSIDVSPPYNARVFINGKQLNESLPIRNYKVPAGTTIKIKAENPFSKKVKYEQITLKQNEHKNLILKLSDKNKKSYNQK